MLQRVEARGSVYLPSINAFYVREFQMMYAAEEAARFLHHACRGLPLRRNGHAVAHRDPWTASMPALEHALAYFGSRVLYPARPAVRDEDGCDFSREACQNVVQAALRGDRTNLTPPPRNWATAWAANSTMPISGDG